MVMLSRLARRKARRDKSRKCHHLTPVGDGDEAHGDGAAHGDGEDAAADEARAPRPALPERHLRALQRPAEMVILLGLARRIAANRESIAVLLVRTAAVVVAGRSARHERGVRLLVEARQDDAGGWERAGRSIRRRVIVRMRPVRRSAVVRREHEQGVVPHAPRFHQVRNVSLSAR